MSLLSKAATFARSPQGRQALDKAKKLAQDPRNKEKLEQLRTRLGQRGGGAPPRQG